MKKSNENMMDLDDLSALALAWTNKFLRKPDLTKDEELQLLACAYANLFLNTCKGQLISLPPSHDLIAMALAKVGQDQLSERHQDLVDGFRRLTKFETAQ